MKNRNSSLKAILVLAAVKAVIDSSVYIIRKIEAVNALKNKGIISPDTKIKDLAVRGRHYQGKRENQ